MRLTVDEFVRRFLLHVLPKRFVRIRHYGLLAGRQVATKLVRCRELLGVTTVPLPAPANPPTAAVDQRDASSNPDPRLCPHCQTPLTRQPLAGGAVPPVRPPATPPLEPERPTVPLTRTDTS